MDKGMSELIVNGGCLLFFLDAQSLHSKNDVVNSTLYAQLAASKKHSKFSAYDDWRERYLAASLRFGWMLKASESISQRMTGQASRTLWDWIRDKLPAFVSATEIKLGEEAARQRYHDFPNQPAIGLLAQQVLQSTIAPVLNQPQAMTVALQLGLVGPGATLTLVQIKFVSHQRLTPGFLFEPLIPASIVGNVELSFYSMQLMDLAYSPFRETFETALEGLRSNLVCPLQEVDDIHLPRKDTSLSVSLCRGI
ncbi:hypothetical protein [Pseudomonas sp. NA-150]|uniref:hypothetical protein n=1 Tax=Pseudomonas sp. NA-150 TaxID=3367525 RepID=UPI0037CB8754